MHAYIHACIHACMHACIHTYKSLEEHNVSRLSHLFPHADLFSSNFLFSSLLWLFPSLLFICPYSFYAHHFFLYLFYPFIQYISIYDIHRCVCVCIYVLSFMYRARHRNGFFLYFSITCLVMSSKARCGDSVAALPSGLGSHYVRTPCRLSQFGRHHIICDGCVGASGPGSAAFWCKGLNQVVNMNHVKSM